MIYYRKINSNKAVFKLKSESASAAQTQVRHFPRSNDFQANPKNFKRSIKKQVKTRNLSFIDTFNNTTIF